MPITKSKTLFLSHEETLDYVKLHGKMPKNARLRYMGWGKTHGSSCQQMEGLVTFYIRSMETGEWIEESYYAMNTTARKKFMERMMKKTNNLNIDRYFTWKPLFYEQL